MSPILKWKADKRRLFEKKIQINIEYFHEKRADCSFYSAPETVWLFSSVLDTLKTGWLFSSVLDTPKTGWT